MANGSVSVRFHHPTKDLSFLTSLLPMESFRNWKAGSRRETMNGEPLKGKYPNSYWAARLKFSGEEGFKNNLIFAIDNLKKIREIIIDMKSSGGKIEIYLQLPGSINNGGTIETEVLKTMCDLNIDLLIEVFPDA
jgi:hypothetical protein